ncbi:MAG: alginate O-acetyltransferase AlgX-related protein, partial [Christensenellales bacterium]
IAFPVYGHLLPGARDDAGERRALAPLPESGFDPAGIEAYFNDRFAFRGRMVALYNRITAQAGARIINNVAIGQDGWLYYTADGSIEDMRREIHHTEAELAAICSAQQEAKEYLESMGIGYYLMICPDKHTVYPEYLPKELQGYAGETRFDGLYAALTEHTDVAVIDTRQAVIDEKAHHEVFYHTDTHWNEYGAFAGYRELMARIAQDYPHVRVIDAADCEVTIDADWNEGDMAEFIGRTDLTDVHISHAVVDSALVQLETAYPETSEDPERAIISLINPNRPDLPSAVVFRDSFCRMLYPMLADSFSRVTFVWTTSVLDHVVRGENPDLVIMEYVERYSGQAVNGVPALEEKRVQYAPDDALPAHMGLIRSNVDHFDATRQIGMVRGWAFVPTREAVAGEKHIAWKNGDAVVYCQTATALRPDVTAHFAQSLKGLNVDQSGFEAYFDQSQLSAGTWQLIVVIDDGAGSAGYAELGKRLRID